MLARAPVLALAAAVLPAQTVHTVGTGGHAEIGSAIAAAAPGDIVEVTTGIYAAFTLDKALTITAAPGAQVDILPRLMASVTLLRPPAGSTARIVGLRFLNPWRLLGTETRVDRGTVWLQDCVCEAPGWRLTAGLEVINATAVLDRCDLAGFGVGLGGVAEQCHGLSADHAQVFASNCRFAGAQSGFDLGVAGAGISATASTVHCVRCTVDGGNGDTTCFYGPGPGILSRNGCQLWLADCTVRGGNGLCSQPGAIGLDHAGPAPASFARTTFAGGNGSPPGPAVVGPVAPAPLLGLGAATMPLRIGQLFAVGYRTQPSWPVVVAVASDLAPHAEPFLQQPALLPLAAASTFALLVADGNGDALLQTGVPAQPALRHARVWLQAASGLGGPLQAAPALGGIVR